MYDWYSNLNMASSQTGNSDLPPLELDYHSRTQLLDQLTPVAQGRQQERGQLQKSITPQQDGTLSASD